MLDIRTRLSGTSADGGKTWTPQDIGDAVSTGGRLSDGYWDRGADQAAGVGDGEPLYVIARIKEEDLASATANATMRMEVVSVPKFTAGTPNTLPTFDFVDGDVSVANNTITEANHGLPNGTRVTLTNAGGALPAGLAAATNYYVIAATANTFKLSLSRGGAAVDITAAAGGGTHTVTWHATVLVSSGEIGLGVLKIDAEVVLVLPPVPEQVDYPMNRYIFARYVATNATTAGKVLTSIGYEPPRSSRSYGPSGIPV